MNWCAYWFKHRYNLMAHEKPLAEKGAVFTGFTVSGFTNEASFLSLDLTCFSVFRDETGTPAIPRRPKRPVTLFPDQDTGMNTAAGTLPFPTTPAHAIATGAVGLNHIKVVYDDGTVIAVNGDRLRPFELDWCGKRVTLAPNCYIGKSGGDMKVFSGFKDGRRVDLSVSPEYVYIDGRGGFVRFDEGASDGLLIRLRYTAVVGKPLGKDEEDVLLLRGATTAELPYTAAKIVPMDLAGLPGDPFAVRGLPACP